MYIWLLLFLACFLLIGAPAYWLMQASERRKRFKLMLAGEESRTPAIATAAIFSAGLESELPPMERLQAKLRKLGWASQLLQPPGTNAKPAVVVMASVALAVAGAFAGGALSGYLGSFAVPLGGALFGSLPVLLLRKQSAKFLTTFEEQLPDAVDFLARSMRSGTALSLSLDAVVAETSEPLRSQFLAVSRELALGAPIELTLKNLLLRVPLLELRFLVAAILLQRETGGNLGEILDKLGSAIRDRLQLKAKVKASSSQGRLTARILSLLPVAVLLIISVISPVYLHTMTSDSSGRAMLFAAVVAQLFAYVCMQKITNIEI